MPLRPQFANRPRRYTQAPRHHNPQFPSANLLHRRTYSYCPSRNCRISPSIPTACPPEFFHRSCCFRPVATSKQTVSRHARSASTARSDSPTPYRTSPRAATTGLPCTRIGLKNVSKRHAPEANKQQVPHQRHARFVPRCNQRFYTMPQQHTSPLLPTSLYDATPTPSAYPAAYVPDKQINARQQTTSRLQADRQQAMLPANQECTPVYKQTNSTTGNHKQANKRPPANTRKPDTQTHRHRSHPDPGSLHRS